MVKSIKNRNKGRNSLAISLIYAFSIFIIVFFLGATITLTVTNPTINSGSIFILPLGILFMIVTIVLARLKYYQLAKFILILVPPYTVLFFSLFSKSDHLTDNLFLYLAPRVFTVIFLMAPVIFFGLKHIKSLVLSIFIIAIPALFFDVIHVYFGVGLSEMEYNLDYYVPFVFLVFVMYIIALLSIIFFQKIGIAFRKTVLEQQGQLRAEKNALDEVNKNLEYQAYLYKILSITSQNKSLKLILKEVLALIIESDSLTTDKKGLIFLTNDEGDLEIAAIHQAEGLLKTCSLIKSGECLCGIALKTKKSSFCNSVGHDHSIIPTGMKPHGHYVSPIIERGEVLGVINVYIRAGSSKDQNIINYLDAIALILAKKIISEKSKELLLLKNREIETQRKELDFTLNELNNSIQYASYLQGALIPNQDTINSYFSNSCVLYLPRDKVSGDFYFAHGSDDILYFGVGDCTGHGIPGAFLASMSIEAIKTVVMDNLGTTPDKLLAKLKQIAIQRFSTNRKADYSESMDAAMCMFNKKTNMLYYSGGFINIYIVDTESNIHEYKASKSPIGRYVVDVEFDLHEIELKNGDTLYITSDGYIDQFGIPPLKTKPQKFKRTRFLKLIKTINHLDSVEQVEILNNQYNSWSGNLDQIDDITVMVVKHAIT